jgi:hypothetical protein
MIQWLIHLLNPLRPLCDEWCLHLWETAGTWLAGVATLLAVIVSLVLARRDRIRLGISAGHRIEVVPGAAGPYPEFLVIAVRNVGSRPATIEGIGWHRRFARRWRHAYQLFNIEGYPGPPVTITPGGAHHFKLPIAQWGGWFVKDFVGRWPRLRVRFIRVQTWTPAGDKFYGPLESGLRDWLIEKASNIAQAGEAHGNG